MSRFEMSSEGANEADQVDRVEDVQAAKDVPSGDARDPGTSDQFRSSDLVADVSLADGVRYTPDGLHVLRTSYVFRVNEVVRGNSAGEYVTIRDTGGVYPDGSSVSTENSFKLIPGGRYVVFADLVGEDLWLRQVFQVHGDGDVVADASGRVLVESREGLPLAQAAPTYEALRYVPAVVRPVEPMEGPPDEASAPLPAHPEASPIARQGALSLQAVVQFLRSGNNQPSSSEGVRPALEGDEDPPAAPPLERQPPADIEEPSQESARGTVSEDPARAVLMGSHVTAFQSHFHFMPRDDNWAWTNHCRGSWNTLVNNNLGLFAYKITTSDGQPIRNRLPVANNNQNNVGVLSNAQMTAGGYDTWDVLSANGVCYRWVDSNNRVRETDILINPAIAGNEDQFRKSLTHEFGHALTLNHETARMALLYPGTFRQPPNYSSLWYSRRDDHQGVRAMLQWVNSNIGAGTWDIAQFTDMATWSQAHDNPGAAGNLVTTRISSETVRRGDVATLNFVHLENRGNVAAQNVRLKFYLSTNEAITANDHEIASFTWNTFTSWWSGSLNVRVPNTVPAGQYFLGWIVTTDTPERSSSNNTAILMRDHTAAFAKVRITVN
ncbi:hypothetical protein P3H15_42240 [Rhodococcus sp. T2V]|uniref:hypothetical protein n=1 Tax=Rhodococcus sp. T2V TaxID=3034164 RepID=UPI0023E112B0|nr:hypothetical protein [Rhodococcus sp. T2V]MDF3311602.1 hypothetical protein [Rhodococcus sp. T2V]